MCGRFVYKGQWETLLTAFPGLETMGDNRGNFNVAPSQEVPVLLREGGAVRMERLRWGLIPFWAKDPSIGDRMINARAETVALKPSFKGLLKRRRCILLADGFYEWVREGKGKTPYFIHLEGRPLFGLAGLWDEWKDPAGGSVRSCTIITTEANAFMRLMHHRMPVILSRTEWPLWLDEAADDVETLTALLKPWPAETMACYPVSRRVNSPAFNSPACIEPSEPGTAATA